MGIVLASHKKLAIVSSKFHKLGVSWSTSGAFRSRLIYLILVAILCCRRIEEIVLTKDNIAVIE